MSSIARIGIYGDLHLCSRNYGAHRKYPEESLTYLHKITELTESKKLTHLIGLGDLAFGRFNTLEYRDAVNKEFEKQKELTSDNHYELFGNHDKASFGMTERDYYIQQGLLKPSKNLTIGNINITMVDYGKTDDTPVNIVDDEQHINIILAHDFYKFTDTRTSNFGDAIILDNLEQWFGADCLICGHVHKIMNFEGCIEKDGMGHILKVYYPGCINRPAYREGHMDEVGQLIILDISDTGELDFSIETIPLWSLSESFNLEKKQKEKAKKQEKEERIDISDIVKQLDLHDRNIGNPEDIIQSMTGIDNKYKNKAIELLKLALA